MSNHLPTPVWGKYYYDHLRRLNQVDYAATCGFALINDLLLFASQWLNDGTLLTIETSESVIPALGAIQSLPSVSSVPSVANNIYSLAEFGESEPIDAKVHTETIYDDQGHIAAQIVYDTNGNMTLFAMYLDDGSKVVVTSAYDKDGNQTSNICTTYDAAGNVVGREDMPLGTETTEIVDSSLTPSVQSVKSYEPEPCQVSFTHFFSFFVFLSVSLLRFARTGGRREWAAWRARRSLTAADEQDAGLSAAAKLHNLTLRRSQRIASSILLFVLTVKAATLDLLRTDSHSLRRDTRRLTFHHDRDVRLFAASVILFTPHAPGCHLVGAPNLR